MDASSFARLPGELRNEIWRLAVVEPKPINITLGWAGPPICTKLAPHPALLSTCRVIRAEATGIYCGDNTFGFLDGFDSELIRMIGKLRRLFGREHVRKISRLRVHPQWLWLARYDTKSIGSEVERETAIRRRERADALLDHMLAAGMRPEVLEIVIESDPIEMRWHKAWDAAMEDKCRA